MNTGLSLPTDVTIAHVVALHSDWRSGLVDDPHPRALGFEFRVRADQVDDIDAAGLQLLLSLRRSVQALGGSFQIIDPSTPLVGACFALGAGSLLVAQTAASAPSIEHRARRYPLAARLRVAAAGSEFVESVCAAEPQVGPGPDKRWHVRTAFGRETFRDGMDPIAMLAEVHRDAVMTALDCYVDSIPPLETIDPQSCFLAYEFDLRTAKSRGEIESALSFVRSFASARPS